MTVTFRIRRGDAATWTAANPVLALGEPGLETDTRKVKYGDGSTAWNSLAYSAAGVIGWADITGKPTTLTGYGITDAAPSSRTISTTAPLTGGGDLSANRTLAITAATSGAAGSMSASDKSKLDGVASGATANDTDANLKNRANHTGTQAHTTITGLGTAATMAGPSGAIVGTTDTQTLSNKTFAAGLQVGGVIGGTLDVLDALATVIIQSSTGTNPARLSFRNTGGPATMGLDRSSGFGFFGGGAPAYSFVFQHEGTAPIVFGHTAPELTITNAGKVGIGTTGPGSLLTLSGGCLNKSAYTVATLPSAPAVGDEARVTDASSPVFGSTVAGGGAANVPVFYNGTNWIVG